MGGGCAGEGGMQFASAIDTSATASSSSKVTYVLDTSRDPFEFVGVGRGH